MQVGSLVQSRFYCDGFGIVLETGWNAITNDNWARVHWQDRLVLDEFQYFDDLEVICK